MPESLFKCNFIKKEALAQVFSCEFLRTPFYRRPPDDCFLSYCYELRIIHTMSFLASHDGGCKRVYGRSMIFLKN